MPYSPQEIAKFHDGIFIEAIDSKYSKRLPRSLIERNVVLAWSEEGFIKAFLAGDKYPQARLPKLLDLIFDIRLQIYYLREITMGLYNECVFDEGYKSPSDPGDLHVHLTKLSLDQCTIVQTRILWERIMNFLFFLEYGIDLEKKVSKTKSKRKTFSIAFVKILDGVFSCVMSLCYTTTTPSLGVLKFTRIPH